MILYVLVAGNHCDCFFFVYILCVIWLKYMYVY